MAQFAPQEVLIPEDGQTVFVLPHPYVMGTGELRIFLNGMLAVVDQDYVETDEVTITFNFQLSSEDIVIAQHLVYFDEKLVNVIDGQGRGIYQKYGVEKRLLENQKYELTFQHGSQVIQSVFYTQMNPMYSSVPVVRNDLPEVFEQFSDQTIQMKIYLNGILAKNIAGETQLSEIEESIPFYLKQYVRYRTELDLVLAIYFAISGRPSSDNTVLGQLEVEKRYRLEDVKHLIQELKDRLKPWEKELRGTTTGGSNLIASAVRGGGSSPYPLNTPRRGGETEE